MLSIKAGASATTDPDRQLHQKPKLGGRQAVSFIKVVTKSTSFALTVPAPFVRRHGDKIQKFTVLQSEQWGERLWTVEVGVNFPHGHPQVILFNGGWKEFAAGHSLVPGDRLGFTLVAMNRFHVSILRCHAKKPRAPQTPKVGIQSPQVCIDLTRDDVDSEPKPHDIDAIHRRTSNTT